jgi:hypothetical protein
MLNIERVIRNISEPGELTTLTGNPTDGYLFTAADAVGQPQFSRRARAPGGNPRLLKPAGLTPNSRGRVRVPAICLKGPCALGRLGAP